jgi:methyl-accepting chemotaxis protein
VRARDLQGEVQRFLAALERAGDRRRFDRHPLSLPCRIAWSGGVVETRLQDISLGGAAVQGDLQIPSGTEATLSVAGAAPLRCRVARPLEGVTGLLFTDPPASEALLRELIPPARAAA